MPLVNFVLTASQQRYSQDFLQSPLPVLAQYFPCLADVLTEIIREDVTVVTHGAWQGLFVLYVSHRFILLLCIPSVFNFLPLFCIPTSLLFFFIIFSFA